MHPWRRLRSIVTAGRTVRVTMALAIGLALMALTSAPASASVEYGTGAIGCSLSATLHFTKKLTPADSATDRTRITATLSQCTTTPNQTGSAFIGRVHGVFAESPFDCTTLTATGPSFTGAVRWRALVSVRKGTYRYRAFRASQVFNDDATGSFAGVTTIALNVPSTLSSECAGTLGVRSLTVSGSITIGQSCGPGTGSVRIYTIGNGPLCGGVYAPVAITAGPDGAMWFSNQGDATIGRMTTSGAVSLFHVPDGGGDITAGPDGALWFTYGNTPNGGIGRITTSGTVSYFTDPQVYDPTTIAAGPDGALWFVDAGNGPSGTSGYNEAIDRLTTSGQFTVYPLPNFSGPTTITVGPDGAMWFVEIGSRSIGRITMSGTITTYSDPGMCPSPGIAAGPDGALWFTNNNSIGRITTSGVVSYFAVPGSVDPWAIAAGPDGALWFTNYSLPGGGAYQGSIGRITTSGAVSLYTSPGIYTPVNIAAGPDGAMWFVDYANDTIGKVATS